MKTKELIKMLQDADPSGETHISMPGGIPIAVFSSPGYWDGPYTYFDEAGNYTVSTEGSKIEIYCIDLDLFIEREFNSKTLDNWEEIKDKIKFKLTYCYPQERINSILKQAKNYFDELVDIHKQFQNNKK